MTHPRFVHTGSIKHRWLSALLVLAFVMTASAQVGAQVSPKEKQANLTWPPKLPDGQAIVTDTSEQFLQPPESAELKPGTKIAKTAPTIDFMFFPHQTYRGEPWTNWGDGLAVGENKYYTAIGDHAAPRGRPLLYGYDAQSKKLRLLVDIRKFLEDGHLPDGMDYTPGKIHSRIDMGRDGWLYYSTHRGSTRGNTTDERGYKGDWIFRTSPETGKTEIAATYPVPKHTIPASVLDPERMIYYGGTAPGNDASIDTGQFLAYDVANGKKLKQVDGGFNRYAILANSTGKVYWKHRGADVGRVYDPETNRVSEFDLPYVRAATRESPDNKVYFFSQGKDQKYSPREDGSMGGILWSFDTRTEEVESLGVAVTGNHTYVTAVEVDPTDGRYVYFVAGAHGRIAEQGTPIVQYDTKTKTRKVIAFVADYYTEKYGYTPDGTFGIGLSADGATLYVTFNGNRIGETSSRYWDSCCLMVIHIPESERRD